MMCSPVLTVQAGSTNVSFVQGDCAEKPSIHQEHETDFSALHMNWVLVDDTTGIPHAQMRWVVDQ